MSWEDFGTTMISIRVPKKILRKLKEEAGHELWDKSYQRLGLRIWEAWVNDWDLPEKYNPPVKKKTKKKTRS